jgi:hypothetical protein
MLLPWVFARFGKQYYDSKIDLYPVEWRKPGMPPWDKKPPEPPDVTARPFAGPFPEKFIPDAVPGVKPLKEREQEATAGLGERPVQLPWADYAARQIKEQNIKQEEPDLKTWAETPLPRRAKNISDARAAKDTSVIPGGYSFPAEADYRAMPQAERREKGDVISLRGMPYLVPGGIPSAV